MSTGDLVVSSSRLHLVLDLVAVWGSGLEDTRVSEKDCFLAFTQMRSNSAVKKVQCGYGIKIAQPSHEHPALKGGNSM